ncbi:hypothetical protein BpHYR1_020650 [Brachionus plicatilis]|uniref:Uncharacterized protein n=1 Tax=Brachionus plicatilis TaxID=10195 RepID=A0A3M7QCA7_BRAPC|nr:hypothetical protein BpHYR1_020650 [Brachionus plicatilis]
MKISYQKCEKKRSMMNKGTKKLSKTLSEFCVTNYAVPVIERYQLMLNLQANNLVIGRQHGLVRKKTCVLN